MKRALSIVAILTLCTSAAFATAEGSMTYSGGTFTWTVTPSDDAYVAQAGLDTTYGTTDPNRLLQASWNPKIYMRFALPTEYYFQNGGGVANIVSGSMSMTLCDDSNRYYHSPIGKAIRIWGMDEANDLVTSSNPNMHWDEDTITWVKAIQYFGNTNENSPSANSKYFVKQASGTGSDVVPGYVYDPNSPPAINVTANWNWPTSVPDANVDPNGIVMSYKFNLMTKVGVTGGSNIVYVGGRYNNVLFDNNRANLLDLIDLDTDNALTLMCSGVYELYLKSSEGASDAQRPTLEIMWVPEPATMSLLVLGAGAALLRRRRS